jgi:hypothetical protein
VNPAGFGGWKDGAKLPGFFVGGDVAVLGRGITLEYYCLLCLPASLSSFLSCCMQSLHTLGLLLTVSWATASCSHNWKAVGLPHKQLHSLPSLEKG